MLEAIFVRVPETDAERSECDHRKLCPVFCDRGELNESLALGDGVLIWQSFERQSDRYGFVRLVQDHEGESQNVPLSLENSEGRVGRLIAEVLETRQPTRMCDVYRGLFTEKPDKGELILLGTGTLLAGKDHAVGCEPEDGRETDWLDPDALYRCHGQTVRLHFVPNRP